MDGVEIAAILGILTCEILKIFSGASLAASSSVDGGILTKLVKQLITVILVGSRYYPVLISLRFKSDQEGIRDETKVTLIQFRALTCIRLLTFAYVIGIIVYTIYRESVCFDFIPQSENFTIGDEVLLRIQLGTRFILFGLLVNIPHFVLLSYIGGEFGMRLVFDSCLQYLKAKNSNRSQPSSQTMPIERISQSQPTSDNSPAVSTLLPSFLRKIRNFIYEPDRNFTFSAISISMYMVNFIILWNLTCTFSFLYTTRTMNPVSFLTKTFEQILNIEIKDSLFHEEIIGCALVTGLIYGFQLRRAIIHFRKNIKKYRIKRYLLKTEKKVEPAEAQAKAIKYPGYLIRYTVGGYVATFHLLLCIVFVPRLIWHHFYAFKYVPEVLLSILILYLLQLLIAQMFDNWLSTRNQTQEPATADDRQQSSTVTDQNRRNNTVYQNNNNSQVSIDRNTSTGSRYWSRFRENIKNIFQYFMLVANCFIGIATSIIRLVLILLINIVCMNRVESCCFPDPFTILDRATIAYWHFIHQEIHTGEIIQPRTVDVPAPPQPTSIPQEPDRHEEQEIDDPDAVVRSPTVEGVAATSTTDISSLIKDR